MDKGIWKILAILIVFVMVGSCVAMPSARDKNLGDSVIEIAASGESKKLIHADAVHGVVIVGFKKGINALEQRSIIEKHNGEILEIDPVMNDVLVRVSDVQAFISKTTEEYAVEYAEPNYIRKVLISLTPGYTPNDPCWDEQYNLRLINVDKAWNCEKGNKSIKIAIVDTGIQYDHPDLKSNYVSGGYDRVNDDSDPYDDNGHGTCCAGIAAAVMNNKEGIAGIAQVSLMAEKVLDENKKGDDEDAAQGIRDAVDEGANIICLSLGGDSPLSRFGDSSFSDFIRHYPSSFADSQSSLLRDACNYAWYKGCLLVAGAGNAGIPYIVYPAQYNTVIAVGAIGKGKGRCSYSNYGPELELMAPGVDVISTNLTGEYAPLSGTSVAVPHVAGVAALIWSRYPSLTNQQIRNILKASAIDLGAAGRDNYYGYGLVDASAVCKIRPPGTIQKAVDNASAGDTIIVSDGIYTENVKVNKCLTIRSENGSASCIVLPAKSSDHVFNVTADYVNISGFTVEEAGDGMAGIYLHYYADYCNISNNNCSNNRIGIGLNKFSNNNSISNNNCSNNWYNIYLWSSTNNRISNNICSNSKNEGIHLLYSNNNSISNNICSNNRREGIHLMNSHHNSISNNNCLNNAKGIYHTNSHHNSILNNNCSNNRIGIYLDDSNNNIIYLNNFINNADNVDSYKSTNIWNSPLEITYTYNGTTYKSYVGNYWDDYEGTDADEDGIGDTGYSIDSDSNESDDCPLMDPFENYILPRSAPA